MYKSKPCASSFICGWIRSIKLIGTNFSITRIMVIMIGDSCIERWDRVVHDRHISWCVTTATPFAVESNHPLCSKCRWSQWSEPLKESCRRCEFDKNIETIGNIGSNPLYWEIRRWLNHFGCNVKSLKGISAHVKTTEGHIIEHSQSNEFIVILFKCIV